MNRGAPSWFCVKKTTFSCNAKKVSMDGALGMLRPNKNLCHPLETCHDSIVNESQVR
jgi:hypothetical protein